jgi:hypothetical protein
VTDTRAPTFTVEGATPITDGVDVSVGAAIEQAAISDPTHMSTERPLGTGASSN